MPTRVLVIAGSDSSGGAGIAADLRALEGHEVLLAITAVTAQSEAGVRRVDPVPIDGLKAQLEAAGPVDAIKIGMLVDAEHVRCVARHLREIDPLPPVVLDPVLRSTSGGELLTEDGVAALWDLFDLVDLVTPNQAEAQVLAGDAPWQAWAEAMPCPVLVTGGDLDGDEIVDVLFIDEDELEYAHPRVPGAFRGTGCQLSSRIAAHLAEDTPLEEAVGLAIQDLEARLERECSIPASETKPPSTS